MKMAKGVIFDFNGTLFQDTDKQEKAWSIIFPRYFGREIRKNEFQENIHGRTNQTILETYFGNADDKNERYAIMLEKEAVYREICLQNHESLRLTNGAEDFFEILQENQIPFTIATASEITNVNFYFEMFNLEKWFNRDKIIYDNGTFPGKPAPDTYLRAAQAIGRNPKDCLVFEDSISGLTSAQNAGIGTIIAVHPERDIEKIREDKKIHMIIDDFTEIDWAKK